MTELTADDIIRPSSRLIELARAAQAGEDSLADGAVGANGFGFVLLSQLETDACWRFLGSMASSLRSGPTVHAGFETVARTRSLVRGQIRITKLVEELFYLLLMAAVPDQTLRRFSFYMGPSGLALGAENAEAYWSCAKTLDDLANAWDAALRKVEPASLDLRAESDFGWHRIRVEGTTPTPLFIDDEVEQVLLEAMQRHTPSDTRALLDVLIAWSALSEERQASHRPAFEAAVRSGWDAGADAIEASLDRLDDHPDDPAARDVVERLFPMMFGYHRPEGLAIERERRRTMGLRRWTLMQQLWPDACW